MYLVQELAMGGDLYLKANDGTRFNEQRTVQDVVKPMLQALKYLHSQASGFTVLETVFVRCDHAWIIEHACMGCMVPYAGGILEQGPNSKN